LVLLPSPTILACWAANFGACWGLSQALSWQGAFPIKGLGLAQGSIGLLGALPAGASVVVVFAASWYSQRLLARGLLARGLLARGLLGGGCVALGGLAVKPCVPGIQAKIALATIGIAVPSVINVIGQTVVSELTPVAQRGALLALGTTIATSAGLLAPDIMGSVVETAATPGRQRRLGGVHGLERFVRAQAALRRGDDALVPRPEPIGADVEVIVTGGMNRPPYQKPASPSRSARRKVLLVPDQKRTGRQRPAR
jgi:hypothetical protein